MKILTVIGARPQFIKAAIVSHAFKDIDTVREVIVHTGQHYDDMLSAVFFRELDIPEPFYNLGVGSHTHGTQTGRMILALEPVMLAEKPDLILVYGDTNSTLAAALVAAKLYIPIAHVEAGLRSFKLRMPEEINRIITDRLSTILFAPTENAVRNLEFEGVPNSRVRLVGDVMYDAALRYFNESRAQNLMLQHELTAKSYVLATIHREENTDNPERLKNIVSSLVDISRTIPVLFPAHPRTNKALLKTGLRSVAKKYFKYVDPIGYLDMLALEKYAHTIVTDSGGVQKEAFYFNVPCIIVREETEWLELIQLGAAKLVAPEDVSAAVLSFSGKVDKDVMLKIFGGGQASSLIAKELSVLPNFL